MRLPTVHQEEIRGKLKWLMALRVVLVTFLLGTSLILQVGYGRPLESLNLFSFLIATTYALTIVYGLLIRRIHRVHGFAHFQLSMDLALVTVLVYSTGGIESPFSPFYMITILSASMILDRRGGILTAFAAGFLYGLIAELQFIRLGLEPSSYTGLETLYLLLTNLVAFVMMAYLGGGLAEKLRTTKDRLVEKSAGLAELQAFHENVVQSISSGVLTMDAQGRVTSLNRAAREITGYTEEEMRGRSWWEVFGAEELRRLMSAEKSLAGSIRVDRECRRKDGTSLFLGMTASPLRDEHGQVTGTVMAFQDLTRIREMEEEVKRKKWLATIGEMAAGIAHEIRNPLASISGAMQVLRLERRLHRESRRLVEIALKETDRLNAIVTAFLLYARPVQLNKKWCDLHELLDEMISLLKKDPDSYGGVQIRTDYDGDRLWVDVDPDQMKQVFWNLAINAVEALPGRGELEVLTRRAGAGRPAARGASPGPWVRVSFKDDGEGIRPENLDKIFYPFFTTKDKGTGLGLAIVHRIVEDHGGRIHVDSRPAAGTTVSVLLPMAENG